MAHRKATGSVKNFGGSQPKYLGTKLYDGETARAGSIIIRQRGTRILAGQNVKMGRDHTLFALKEGRVKFSSKRHKNFNGQTQIKKMVNVIKK